MDIGVTANGTRLDLTAMESIVLRTLVEKQSDVADSYTTHGELQSAIAERFPKAAQACSNSLQVIISRLRRKLRDVEAGVGIHMVRGKGYTLIADSVTA